MQFFLLAADLNQRATRFALARFGFELLPTSVEFKAHALQDQDAILIIGKSLNRLGRSEKLRQRHRSKPDKT